MTIKLILAAAFCGLSFSAYAQQSRQAPPPQQTQQKGKSLEACCAEFGGHIEGRVCKGIGSSTGQNLAWQTCRGQR